MAEMNLQTFNDVGDEIDRQRMRGIREGKSHLFALLHYVQEVSSAMGDLGDHQDEGEHVQEKIQSKLRSALVSLAARAWIAIDEMDEEGS